MSQARHVSKRCSARRDCKAITARRAIETSACVTSRDGTNLLRTGEGTMTPDKTNKPSPDASRPHPRKAGLLPDRLRPDRVPRFGGERASRLRATTRSAFCGPTARRRHVTAARRRTPLTLRVRSPGRTPRPSPSTTRPARFWSTITRSSSPTPRHSSPSSTCSLTTRPTNSSSRTCRKRLVETIRPSGVANRA
jgi:hypothetical protein